MSPGPNPEHELYNDRTFVERQTQSSPKIVPDRCNREARSAEFANSSDTRADAVWSDRRRAVRAHVEWRVTYSELVKCYQGTPAQGSTKDISPRGLCFLVDELLTPGTWLNIGLESEDLDTCAVLAEVRWSSPLAEGYEVGVAFSVSGWGSCTAQERIAAYLDAQEERVSGASHDG